MVTILQKVTTFPLEMIDKTSLSFLDISGSEIYDYYSNPKIGSGIPGTTEDYTTIDRLNSDRQTQLKKRMIVYSIYDKLFENSLNMLEKSIKENTIIIFPTKEQNDKGQMDLNPKVRNFYNKISKIKTLVSFNEQKYCYIELPVFNNQKNDEYKNTIKYNFEKIRKLILEYNAEIVKQKIYRPVIATGSGGVGEPIQNVIFILDSDKKGLFTGLYNKQLSKEKKDILNKEYSSFLSNQGFRSTSVNDSAINITYSDVVKKAKYLKQEYKIIIGSGIISKEEFEKHILQLKNGYKKIIDKEYKKALELKDNVNTFHILYKIENADKVLEDKIETGPNKLYYIYRDRKGAIKQVKKGQKEKKYVHVIGYFTLTSKERGIYRFREDISQFKNRIAAQRVYNSKTTITRLDENVIEDEDENKNEDEEIVIDKEFESLPYDFAVKIKYQYGSFQYKNLDVNVKQDEIAGVNVKKGEIEPFIDKLKATYKWFNLRDIDLSFLNKEEIKYYPDILFDKKSLIEYLKSKQKYTDKTVLSYEFLKINDSAELSEYCDFIHKYFESNIKDEDSINPFKFTFNNESIIKNIMDIIFEINTPLYLRESNVIKEESRKDTTDSYKIIEYKIQNVNEKNAKIFFEKDTESCSSELNSKYNCYKKYKDKDDKDEPDKIDKNAIKKVVKIIVTKTNIKDGGLLKSTVTCKTRKEKLIYNYKKLFANVTKRLAFGIYGGSRKRRLKAKRYK